MREKEKNKDKEVDTINVVPTFHRVSEWWKRAMTLKIELQNISAADKIISRSRKKNENTMLGTTEELNLRVNSSNTWIAYKTNLKQYNNTTCAPNQLTIDFSGNVLYFTYFSAYNSTSSVSHSITSYARSLISRIDKSLAQFFFILFSIELSYSRIVA